MMRAFLWRYASGFGCSAQACCHLGFFETIFHPSRRAAWLGQRMIQQTFGWPFGETTGADPETSGSMPLSTQKSITSRLAFSQGAANFAVREFTKHYHAERNHQGRGNELIETPRKEPNMDGAVEYRERLGGVLKYYRRQQ